MPFRHLTPPPVDRLGPPSLASRRPPLHFRGLTLPLTLLADIMHLPPYTCSLAASRPPASHRRATFFCAPYALDVAAALAPDTSLLGNQLYLARVGRALIVRYLSLPPPPPPLLVASTVMPHEYVTATVKEVRTCCSMSHHCSLSPSDDLVFAHSRLECCGYVLTRAILSSFTDF